VGTIYRYLFQIYGRPEGAQFGRSIGDLMRGERAMDKSVALGEEGEQGGDG
jgi:hypothetical protein